MNAADISTDNSSVALLGIGGVFTGNWEDCHHYGAVSVSVWSDQASAANGFALQFSNNASNVIKSLTRTLAAGTGEWMRDEIPAKWVRVVYTNGPVAQGTFSLEMLKKYIDVARVAVESEDDPVNVILSTGVSDLTGSGTISTASTNVDINVAGRSTLQVQLGPGFAVTTTGLYFLISNDGVNFTPLSAFGTPFFSNGFQRAGMSLITSSFLDGDVLTLPVAGLTTVRLHSNSAFVGTCPFHWRASAEEAAVVVSGQVALFSAGNAGTDGRTNSPLVLFDSIATQPIIHLTYPHVFNGASWDRVRGTVAGMAVVVNALVPATGVAYTDRSLAIALGGAAEQLMAANATRKVLAVANSMENSEIIWISPVTTASVQGLGSIAIFPGGMWEPEVPPLGAISVLAPTTGTNVSAWEG